MNLLDAARMDNNLFFSSEGFTALAVLSSATDTAKVYCFYSRIEETQDKLSGAHQSQKQSQVTFVKNMLPAWFGRQTQIILTDSAGETNRYSIKSINEDRMLGRVHVWLSTGMQGEIPV